MSLAVPEEHVFLDKIISNHLIYDTIFHSSNPMALLRLSRSCRLAHEVVRSYIKRTFNINLILTRYFADPIAFRCLQARTGTLISGSSALQFFDRVFYPESDLDLYIPMKSRVEVGRWLLSQGYKYIPNEGQDPDFEKAAADNRMNSFYELYSMKGVAGVFTFIKPSPSDPDTQLKVQAIIATHTPMHIIILFHSTCVMNVISFDKAYCLYPRGTLEGRRSLVCRRNMDGRHEEAMQKYIARGFNMDRHLLNPHDRSFQETLRWLGDGQCWTLSLDTAGVELPKPLTRRSTVYTTDPVTATSWRLDHDRSDRHPEMAIILIRDKHLHHEYIAGSSECLRTASDMLQAVVKRSHKEGESSEDKRFYDAEYVECCLKFFHNRQPARSNARKVRG